MQKWRFGLPKIVVWDVLDPESKFDTMNGGRMLWVSNLNVSYNQISLQKNFEISKFYEGKKGPRRVNGDVGSPIYGHRFSFYKSRLGPTKSQLLTKLE